MGETNQCDGCQRGLPVDTQGTHYDPAEAGVDAWSRYRIGCTRQRYAEPDPRDAEIARLREEVDRVTQTAVTLVTRSACAEHAAHVRTLSFDEFTSQEEGQCWRCLRAQLAAAQADAVALRGALSDLFLLEGSCDILRLDGAREQAARALNLPPYAPLRPALAPPAPGAPLLDAVRELVEAGDAVVAHDCNHPTIEGYAPCVVCWDTQVDLESALDTALAAVRAVLSCAQDTAGISRGGDG